MRKHLTYANVAATFALVFAMSGGALAAKHYLLNSVAQINPRVVESLRRSPAASQWAQVEGAGRIRTSSRGVQVRRLDAGVYELGFPRQVSQCAPQVTEGGLPGRFAGGYVPEGAEGAATATLALPGGYGVGIPGSSYPSGNAVQVSTNGPTGTRTDSAFYIVVTC